jgi:hypothetical protein
MNEEIDIQYMRYRLADYYEDAGFADVYERELKNYSSEKTKELFINAFGEDEPMYDSEDTD